MVSEFLIYIIENVLFWAFVYIIVFMGCDTPSIVFTGFGFFLFYWIARSIFKQQGMDRLLWTYAFNMFITITLLYFFISGAGIQKSFRNILNSAAKRYPGLEPLVKRC